MLLQNDTYTNKVLKQTLHKNQNPQGFKICIKQVMKGLEDKTYWYYTADQAVFLENVYKKEVTQEQLRNRLKQITDQSMDQLFQDILTNKISKVAVQQHDLIASIRVMQKVQNMAANGSDFHSSQHPIAKQTQNRIKQISQDYKQFKQKVQQIKHRQQQKQLQKQSIEKQIRDKIQQQKRVQYHKSIMLKMQIMKQKQSQRLEQNQKFKIFLKQYKKSKPLHMLMQQDFKQKIQLPQLQQSRKKLQLYKSKKKPTLQQINDHQRAYMTIKQTRPQKRVVQHQSIDVGYKSHFYKEIEEQEKQGTDDQYGSGVWDQMEKKKRYSLMVKEQFKPKTSRVYQNSIDQARAQTSLRKVAPDLSRVKQIGKFYLQYVKNLQKNRHPDHQQQQQAQSNKASQSRYINYLQDLKNSNQMKRKSAGSDWQIDLNDRTSSKSQKRDRILIKSKQLEQKAMREQMFIKNHNYGKAEDIIDRKKEVDQTLLQAIKAKMALLKEVNTY